MIRANIIIVITARLIDLLVRYAICQRYDASVHTCGPLPVCVSFPNYLDEITHALEG